MALQATSQREFLLSLWAKDRLAERETVAWAVDALAKIRGSIGEESALLFELLDTEANKSELPVSLKTLWQLFAKVARESVFREEMGSIYNFKDKLKEGHLRREDIDRLINRLRPRLKVKALTHWRETATEISDNPLEWVDWSFETALHSSYQREARPNRAELATLSPELLFRVLEAGTIALNDAMDDARQIGWLREDRDLPNYYVHRVFAFQTESEPDEDDDIYDADDSNNNLVPIVRLLAESFEALAEKDIKRSKAVSESWKTQSCGLFLRLFAVSSLNAQVQNGRAIAEFLLNLKDDAFWLWDQYPEIATLRALRWNDIQQDHQERIRVRLLGGPPVRDLGEGDDAAERYRQYRRDHELARIVDTGQNVSADFAEIVDARRMVDDEFPKKVSPIESGLPRATVSWGSQGSADVFKDVPASELLALLALPGTGRFGERDDAEALTSTVDGKRRIVEALEIGGGDEDTTTTVWKVLLSYSHVKDDDVQSDQLVIERIAALALNLPPTVLARIADPLCYWIDAADERIPRFRGSEQLWFALLPFAAREVDNEGDSNTTEIETDVDLTTAALNEPLGHLLSFFTRRCPTIPAEGERPPLPVNFVSKLKKLRGRARELLANRMVVQMNYFARADRAWLDEEVLLPMTKDGGKSDRLWEAFAKYSRIPPPNVWEQLQIHSLRRLSSQGLSPEALRRLAEINVVIWIWSKDATSGFRVDSAKMRTALGLANEAVRGAVAWQFSSMFRSKQETTDVEKALWPRVGPPFFREIWPLEPALQSAQSAHDFARIPVRVGATHFVEALNIILPYLLPFEVWSIESGFGLDSKEDTTKYIMTHFSSEVLSLLSACLSERQQHAVYDLGSFLDRLVAKHPEMRRDSRMRFLRKFSVQQHR